MIRECFKTKTGIIFDRDMLKDLIGIDADTLYPEVLPRPPRIRAPLGQQLVPMEHQPSAFLEFFKVIGSLIAIPFEILYGVITWPIKHFFLLLKFTGLFKRVRKSTPWKAIRNFFRKKETVPKSPLLLASQPSSPFITEEDEEFEGDHGELDSEEDGDMVEDIEDSHWLHPAPPVDQFAFTGTLDSSSLLFQSVSESVKLACSA